MRLKKNKDNKSERTSFRASQREYNKMLIKAKLYTEGNLSEWIIFAAINHKPHREDFEKAPGKGG